MVERAILDARDEVTRLCMLAESAAADLKRGNAWLAREPSCEEWQSFVTVTASTLAKLRRELARAREGLRVAHVRAVLHRRAIVRREPPPIRLDVKPMEQLALAFRATGPRRPPPPAAPTWDLHEQPAATAVELPAGEDPEDECDDAPRCQCGATLMACEAETGLCDECRPVAEEMGIADDYVPDLSSPGLSAEDLHERPAAAAVELPAGEDGPEPLAEAELVHVDELPPAFCELCRQDRPGTQWNERRGLRLCPVHWPAEDLVLGVAA